MKGHYLNLMTSPAGFTPARSKTWFHNRFCNDILSRRCLHLHMYTNIVELTVV